MRQKFTAFVGEQVFGEIIFESKDGTVETEENLARLYSFVDEIVPIVGQSYLDRGEDPPEECPIQLRTEVLD